MLQFGSVKASSANTLSVKSRAYMSRASTSSNAPAELRKGLFRVEHTYLKPDTWSTALRPKTDVGSATALQVAQIAIVD
jgi:hypothetical protein